MLVLLSGCSSNRDGCLFEFDDRDNIGQVAGMKRENKARTRTIPINDVLRLLVLGLSSKTDSQTIPGIH
tara:strand:+ start:380 stop:586 length:207 start_codon:yes stop_codon:yes gene_type:complete